MTRRKPAAKASKRPASASRRAAEAGQGPDLPKELAALLADAAAAEVAVARETGERIRQWLMLLAEGRLTAAELRALIEARRRVVRQHLNTLDVETRARLERITLGALDYVLDKVLSRLV